MSTAASPVSRPAQKRGWAVVIAAVAAWFGLWYLTPGLLGNGVGRLFTDAPEVALLIEIIFALAIAVALLLAHLQYNRDLFARSRTIWFYTLPLIAGIALPLHYDMKLPIALYMCWWIVSVFWQNYLTFGLLQRYLAKRLPIWAVLGASAVIFWAGHALVPTR